MKQCCLCDREYNTDDNTDEYCPDCIGYMNNVSEQNEETCD